jgi:hypothetical protein
VWLWKRDYPADYSWLNSPEGLFSFSLIFKKKYSKKLILLSQTKSLPSLIFAGGV